MEYKAKSKKTVFLYTLYVAALIFICGMFTYKFFENKFKLRFDSFIRKTRYFIALHTEHTPAKEEYLKKCKDVEDAWSRISYLVHVPYLMFQYTPNFRSPYLNTNDMGFRGTEDYSHLPSVKVDKNYRYVVLLGGSSAFGAFSTSDERSISGQLEKMLNNYYKTGRRFKVINLGMGFYNSFQEFIAYCLYGAKFHPEIVITFDGFNDAAISSKDRHSKHVPLVSGNYYYTKEVLNKINTLSLKNKPSFLTAENNTTSWDKESNDFVNDVVELYKRNLDLICLVARENGAKVILTLQPIQVLKNGHLAWRYDKKYLEQIYTLMPEKIEEIAKKHSAIFINFQDIFSKNPEYNDYFSYIDPVHLIDKGQEVVANLMMEKIKYILPDED